MMAIKRQQEQKASRTHSKVIQKRLSSIQEEGIIIPSSFAVTTVTFCQAGSCSLTQHYETVSHC